MITDRIGLHSVLLPLLIIYSFTIIVIIIFPLPEHPLVQEFPDSAHVRYIKILMWLWGFFILFSIFGLVFFVLKSLLGIARRWSHEKFAILSLKPQSHVRILIYRTWAIGNELTNNLNITLHELFKSLSEYHK